MSDVNDKLARVLAEADALYAAEQNDTELPPINPATIAMRNLAKSKIVNVRLTEDDHAALKATAQAKGVNVSDVVRAAVLQYLHQRGDTDDAVALLTLLRERGLKLVVDSA